MIGVRELNESLCIGPISCHILNELIGRITFLLKDRRMKLVKSVYILDREYSKDELIRASLKIGSGIQLFNFEVNECGYIHHIHSYDLSYEELEDIACLIKKYAK
jgi:hypothetical protein